MRIICSSLQHENLERYAKDFHIADYFSIEMLISFPSLSPGKDRNTPKKQYSDTPSDQRLLTYSPDQVQHDQLYLANMNVSRPIHNSLHAPPILVLQGCNVQNFAMHIMEKEHFTT